MNDHNIRERPLTVASALPSWRKKTTAADFLACLPAGANAGANAGGGGSSGERGGLVEGDLIVTVGKINYGMKDQDPISHVKVGGGVGS